MIVIILIAAVVKHPRFSVAPINHSLEGYNENDNSESRPFGFHPANFARFHAHDCCD